MLSELAKMTDQEVFDKVVWHLIGQGEKSQRLSMKYGTPMCAYRGADGAKCAAGCLIDDSEYIESLEGVNWGSLVEGGMVPTAHRELIDDLQSTHDKYNPVDWPRQLAEVAWDYGLSESAIYAAQKHKSEGRSCE